MNYINTAVALIIVIHIAKRIIQPVNTEKSTMLRTNILKA